jgi:hypothetical protein
VSSALLVVAFRLANPFAFAGPNVFGLSLSPGWLADMVSLAGMSQMVDFPPNWQWMAGYGALRFLRDFGLFGAGPVLALLLIWGLRRPAGLASAPQLILLSYLSVFLMQGVATTVPALRYAAPALPAIAALCAPILASLSGPVALAAVGLGLWWGAGAVRLHDGAHPRILASRWVWELPRGTVLVNETSWDEGLPVQVYLLGAKEKRWAGFEDHFRFLTLDIVNADTPEKADLMAGMIAAGDYVIVSSGRQSEVMPRLPERFPMTTAYYQMLLSGMPCLPLEWTSDRGYPLPLLPFDDRWAQEPWRVYDHPVVRIYKREVCFDAAAFAETLRASLPH